MLISQPFYIKGIKTKEEVETAKGSAFGAAAAFFFTFVSCILVLINDARKYSSSVVMGNGGGGRNGSSDGASRYVESRWSPNNRPAAAMPGSLFHDYDPVDTDTPVDEFVSDRGVFS